jgi:hypothetical protein
MAKQLQHLDIEIKHFMNFVQHLFPHFKKRDLKTLLEVLNSGLMEVSTGFEKAVCEVGGHDHVSLPQGDGYRDGKYCDMKLATVRTSSYGKSYSGPVTNLANKLGSLRVQMYERKQGKFFYFVIPHRAYKHIPRSSNIEIPFELDGTPRKKPSRKVKVNWWKFEVPDFETMSKK